MDDGWHLHWAGLFGRTARRSVRRQSTERCRRKESQRQKRGHNTAAAMLLFVSNTHCSLYFVSLYVCPLWFLAWPCTICAIVGLHE